MLREPTRTKWWGTAGAPSIPRSVDSRPPWQVACRLRLRRAGARERAQAGSVPRIARWLEGKKLGLIIAVARAPRRRAMTFPSPIHSAQLAQKKKKKGRFGVGAGLRGQIPDRPPILEGSVGPSEAPLTYRPTSFRPSQQGLCFSRLTKRKERMEVFRTVTNSRCEFHLVVFMMFTLVHSLSSAW